MSQRVCSGLPVLKRLKRMSEQKRRTFIKTCDKDVINVLCECAKNLLKGRVSLTNHQIRQLQRWKTSLRVLAVKRTPIKAKKSILQKGGFLSALLPPILSVIGGLASQFFSK